MADSNVTPSAHAMPFNLEAEQAVLGSILIEPTCMSQAIKYINADSFYLPQHKAIFSAMQMMYNKDDNAIDPVIIADALVKEGHYDSSGGKAYLLQIAGSVPSTTNIEHYAKIVRDQFLYRSIISVANEIIDLASQSEAQPSELLDRAEQMIYDIRQGKDINAPTKLSEIIVNDVYTNLALLSGADRDKYLGIPSGFGLLDKYLSGLNKSDLILIGARPAMGKTSFALNLALNISSIAKKKCVVFSLEMTKVQLAERLLASQSGIEAQKIKRGELSNEEWIRLGNVAGQLEDVQLYLDDSTNITVAEMKSKIRRMKDVDCVIVDYLGLISSSGKKENRVQEVSEITRNLKMMAKDLNIPVICCAQLSRGTEGHGKNHRPQLADLRESGSIEQDADIVLFLYREAYYSSDVAEDKQDEIDDNKTELIIAKNRHGAVGTVEMTFDKEFTRFRVIDKNQSEE